MRPAVVVVPIPMEVEVITVLPTTILVDVIIPEALISLTVIPVDVIIPEALISLTVIPVEWTVFPPT